MNESQLVTLKVDSILAPVYCHLGDFGCGDGGWTPVMKIDGKKVGLFKIKTLLPYTHREILQQHFDFLALNNCVSVASIAKIFRDKTLSQKKAGHPYM